MNDTKSIARKGRTILRWFIGIVIVALALFIYARYFFVFGEGVKSGQLNFIVHKGYIFKTYEGRMIQVGYRSTSGTIQSNEFDFSVADENVAKELELKSGKILDLHYKEHLGTLPWRGMSRYIVDKVVGEHEAPGDQTPLATFPATGNPVQ